MILGPAEMLQFGVRVSGEFWWSMVGVVGKNVDVTCENVARLGRSDEMTSKNEDEKNHVCSNRLERYAENIGASTPD